MLERHILPSVRAALADTPAVFLAGPRQAGKSTLAQGLCGGDPGRRYLTLDDASVLAAARRDPEGFLSGLANPVVLDEVQRAPELFRALKASIDRDRKAGRFLLTGSAGILVVPQVAEALAGRVELLNLWPFSQGEIEGTIETFIDACFGEHPPKGDGEPLSRRQLCEAVVRGGRRGRCVAIEIKASASVGSGDLKGIETFAASAGKRFHRGMILYTGRDVVPFSRNIQALPVSALWRS